MSDPYEPEDNGRWCTARCRWILDWEEPRHYCPHCEELFCSAECLADHIAECGEKPKEESSMPHDKNGALLEVGDEVLIRAKVKQIWPGAETCNLQVETTEKMLASHDTGSSITLNANQVEKVSVPEAETLADA